MLFVFNSNVFISHWLSSPPLCPLRRSIYLRLRNNKLAVSVSSGGNLGGRPKTALCFLNNDEPPGQHHHFTCPSPSPSNQYLLAWSSGSVMQIGPYILPPSSTKQVTQFLGSVSMMYGWQSVMYSELVTLRQSFRQTSDVFRVRARVRWVGRSAHAWLRLWCFSWMSPKCFVPICVRRFGICKAIFSNSEF